MNKRMFMDDAKVTVTLGIDWKKVAGSPEMVSRAYLVAGKRDQAGAIPAVVTFRKNCFLNF